MILKGSIPRPFWRQLRIKPSKKLSVKSGKGDYRTLDAQLEQLGAAGCDPVFRETMSGSRNDRPELKKALATLSEGDVLVMTRLDRLARSAER